MNIRKIREKARNMGLKDLTASKTELVRIIQKAEGNSPCFGTAVGNCPHSDCCFRQDCFPG